MALTWRPLTLDDVLAAVHLSNTVAEADGTGQAESEVGLRERLHAPRFDPENDTVLLWDGADLIGMGLVLGRDELVDGRSLVSINGDIHPERRGRGLGSALLTRLETRAVELGQQRHPGQPVRLRASGGIPDSSAQHLLQTRGYAADNFFVTMQVQLADWDDLNTTSSAVVPTEDQLRASREAHNDAFRDHRNFSPVAADLWEHWGKASEFRPDLCQVVLDGDRVLAYALAGEHEDGILHVELVGTRREARGRGLAHDVLLASLRAARDAGYRISELEVDSTSPTGAHRLYASLGYEPVRVISRYVRDVA